VRAAPADVQSWAMLLRAHWHLEHAAELRASLEQAEESLRAAGAWGVHAIEVLALTAGECGLAEESAELIDGAIALHTRSAPNRGIGDGVLSRFYEIKARALAGLGRTDEAVDAAAGAVVAWGPRQDQRRESLAVLESVLAGAQDLPDYVARFEAEVQSSGLENPIVRKALAAALSGRGDHQGAAAQLEQALLQEPNDLESRAALVAAYRSLGRDDLVARSLLAHARAAGHELALYEQLGDHLQATDYQALAERAYTNLVELSAHESEGHAALAAVRERQGAFDQALVHWSHVVRVRTQEPTGYLGRARALIGLERYDEARAELDLLRGREWPEHFSNVRGEVETLERQLSRRG
jgi:tetratricopeptide (TPR) repeat protein